MEVLDVIKERFSPYEFLDKAISQEDVNTLFETLGKEASAVPHIRKPDIRKKYVDHYCTESCELVKRIYKEDFDAFDYDIHELDGLLKK